MIEVSEILQKAKQATVLNIASQMGFDETADILEKGKRAQVGEIRDWKGVKMQKTANGWVPVKQQSKGDVKLPDEGKLIYEPKDADIHNRMEVEKRGDKYVVREVGNNGKKRFLKETDAKGAQEMLKNHTFDMDKNTSPKDKDDKQTLQSLKEKLEDWNVPIHGNIMTRSKTGHRLKITFPVDQKWIEGSDSYENLESKMKSVLDEHKKELDEMGVRYKFDIVPGGRGTEDIACYFRIK